MPDNEVKLDLNILHKIEKELEKKFSVKLGILGSKDSRGDGSNATIGLEMEKGVLSKNIKPASFLVMPLNEKLPKELNSIGQDTFDALAKQDINLLFKKLGIKGEEIVQDAFDTGGFGKWPKNSETTIKLKGFDKRNIETTQLRKSVTSEVIKE